MSRAAEDLKTRTKEFALRVIRVVDSLPRKRSADIVGGQLLRAGTSVGANYRASCRARSPAEFRAKLGIVEEEADESVYWLEFLSESGLVAESKLRNLLQEANEPSRIHQIMAAEFEVDPAQLKRDLVEHLRELLDAGLIEIVDTRKNGASDHR